MTREDFGLRLLEGGELLIDRSCDQPMQIFPPALEQSLISRVPDQGVLELIGGLRSNTAHIQQFDLRQSTQRILQLLFGYRMDCAQQFVREFAANYRSDLDDFLRLPQAIQPRH